MYVTSSLYDLHRIMAEVSLVQGEYERCEKYLNKAEELADENGNDIEPQTYAQGRIVFAKLAGANGNYEKAHNYLEEARRAFVKQQYYKDVVRLDILRAEFLIREKKFGEAKTVLEEAYDLAQSRNRSQDEAKIEDLLRQLPN